MSQQNGPQIFCTNEQPALPATSALNKKVGPFKTALSLHRENATLNPETANVEEKHPQHNQPKET